MSADQRFYLTCLLITAGLTVLGWLLRRAIGAQDQTVRDNTKAIRELTEAMSSVVERVARLEGPVSPNQRAGRRH
jgi:hypothetical protein